MNCTFCGASLPDGAQNCPRCGAPTMSSVRGMTGQAAGARQVQTADQTRPEGPAQAQPQPQMTSAQSVVRCTSCGATLPAGSAFCSRCGASLSGPTDHQKTASKQQARDFWENVDAEAKREAKERRKGSCIGWIIRLVGVALLAYAIWQIVS